MIYSRCNRAVMAAVACALAAAVVTPRYVFAQAAIDSGPKADGPKADDDGLEQVVVTGSFIKRPADRPQPLTILNSDDLNNQQRNSVAESLKDLPQNVGSMAVVNTQGGGVDAGNSPTTTVNLRGLGAGATLVLLNGGRQIADGGYGYVDVNNLAPSIMIDRVETLTDGSSALYGSDAVAGVMNFITKKKFDGMEVKADFQRIQDTTHDRPDMNVGALWGTHTDTTSIVAGLEYQETEVLLTDDRYSADRLKYALTSGFGNPASFQYRVAGATQPSAVAASFGDPLCGSPLLGNGGPSGLANGTFSKTGTPSCLLYNALGRALQPKSQRINALTTINHQFSDTITGDFEVGYARTRYQIPFGYVTPATSTPSLFPLVPADNPGAIATARMFPTFPSPINGQTNVTGYLYKGRILSPWIDDGQEGDIRTSGQDTFRVSGRLNGKFGNSGWDWQLGLADSWNDTNFAGHDTVINRVSLAVNGYGGPACAYTPATDPTGVHRGVNACQFWDPFAIAALAKPGDPAYNNPSLTNWLIGMRTTRDSGQLKTYDAVTTGKLWDMPGGTTGLAIGFERRELNFGQTWDDGSKQIGYWGFNGAAFAQSDFSGSNATNAGFVEMVMYPTKAWEIQLAGRYEKTSYDSAGSFDKFTPKVGVVWRPLRGLFVRASAGTSFQAPGPANLFAQSTGGTSAQTIGGDVINARGLLSGNPNLKPETSRNWNVGVTWDITENFTADINYWNIRFTDLIAAQNAQQILTADEADGFINDPHIVLAAGAPNEICEITGRWKPGQGPRPANCMSGNDILQFTTTYVNQGFLHTNGVDYDFKYRVKANNIGMQFPVRLYGTWTREYLMNQGGIIYNGVGRYNDSTFGVPIPKYNANLQAGAIVGNNSLLATVRFTPAMHLQVPNPATNAGTQSKSFTTLDLLYRYTLPWSQASSVTAAIENVTNAQDPIYGGSQLTVFNNTYNFLGRVFRVGVDYKF